MNKPVKLPEIRKEAFTKARESLGLSTKDLSGMACLSVRQIEQIENGETSSYYGDQVKFTAAKKVAALLKLTPEDAFNFGDLIQPAKAAEPEEKLQEETKVSAVEKKSDEKKQVEEKEAAPAVKVLDQKPETVSARKISQTAIDYRVKTKASIDPKRKLFFLLAIAAVVIFSVVNLRPLFFPEPVKEEVVIVEQVVQAPETDPKIEPTPSTSGAQASGPITPSPAAIAAAECPVADSSVMNYKPDAPKKAGDNVYLQSKSAQTVCVVDATGKTQIKLLEPGVGVSVYGKPPFKVLTGGLNQVDLYYQGAKVRLGNATGKTINLEPAEIIQPAAPLPSSDSQLR